MLVTAANRAYLIDLGLAVDLSSKDDLEVLSKKSRFVSINSKTLRFYALIVW